MAYAAIISLKQTLEQILIHPHRYSIPCDNEHIESFREKIEFLRHFLEECPSHKSIEKVTIGMSTKISMVTSLERRIRDAAYEAEDFMDLHLKNILDSEEIKVEINIELIMKNVDSIIKEVTETKEQMGLVIKLRRRSLKEEEIKTSEEPPNALRMDSSCSTKNLMVGFDEYLMQIKDQLTGHSSALEVISIVGMGGIGKTTLATHAYNDPSVVYKFDVCAWASVSQSYSVRDIMLGMLDSMKILTKEMNQERDDQLGVLVYQNLKGRRYLITIDDIWDTNVWDCLKMMFPDDEMGSRIMLTTRIVDVAAYGSRFGTLHQISLLSDDQSWKLLCAKVFGDEPCPLNLQEIGKTIAKNCRGLPLSIVVIGGLLSKLEKTQIGWQSIAKNVSSFVFSSDDQCSDILRLSYNYLPQYLKACFLYMGVFPKNHEIHVSKLTMMWVAEGFLRQDDGQCPEEVAERCVEDLLDRSLILMSKKNYEGKIKSFKIHDLLLDFCVQEAMDEKFLKITRGNLNFHTISERRISIQRVEKFKPGIRRIRMMRRVENFKPGIQVDDFEFTPSTSYVRSILCVGQRNIFSDMLLRFKLLRVLDATEIWFQYFPPQVLALLNLRYIALLCDGDIPTSITMLCNLQTLIISGDRWRYSKNRLPMEIWMLVHLRHVKFDRVYLLDPSTANFDFYREHLVLKDLQTLSGLWNLRFTEEMLHSIPNIKKIDVSYDALGLFGKKWSYYQIENLGNLHHLKALKIRASPNLHWSLNWTSPSIFKFQFPPSLKTLTLGGVEIPWNDLAIIGSLPNLEVLKLKDHACVGTEWEPNEDEFCVLKVLVLEDLYLKHWKADSNHFPSLERLIIGRCGSLVEIPSGMGESATLSIIELYECNATVSVSANVILEKQLSYGNDGFQVINADPKPKGSRRTRHSLLRLLRLERSD